jgi:hypothetical protein
MDSQLFPKAPKARNREKGVTVRNGPNLADSLTTTVLDYARLRVPVSRRLWLWWLTAGFFLVHIAANGIAIGVSVTLMHREMYGLPAGHGLPTIALAALAWRRSSSCWECAWMMTNMVGLLGVLMSAMGTKRGSSWLVAYLVVAFALGAFEVGTFVILWSYSPIAVYLPGSSRTLTTFPLEWEPLLLLASPCCIAAVIGLSRVCRVVPGQAHNAENRENRNSHE